MCKFRITRMLQAAKNTSLAQQDRDQAPPNMLKDVLIFLLIFGIGSMTQAILLSPFQLTVLFSSEAFKNLLSSGCSFAEIMKALPNLEVIFPHWLMAVHLCLTSTTIAACLIYCRRIEKRSFLSLGFVKQGAVGEYAAGLGIGLLMFGGAIGLALLTGHLTLALTPSPAWGLILFYFLGFMIQGMSEEVLCRSYLMVSLQRGYPLWAAVLINALIFTALHLGNPGITPLALLNLTLFGIFASLYTLRRGSIWGIGALHAIWNFAQGNLFGISVSGITGTPSLLTATVSEGGALIHGGAFGMEGGLAVTLVMTVGCVVLMAMRTKKSELVET
ncbi:MAG: CPBP family intramembrane metalloprotease [Ruminococcaceae bacterium]|nr:CPBP family intramembrane metalloprotease [Oscillospiraceae bacterium]